MRHFGVTLLEVILSLVILGGALAALGQLSRMALQNARESRELTQAELLAESILAKVQLGIIKMESVVDEPITADSKAGLSSDLISDTNAISAGISGEPLWVYTLDVRPVDVYTTECAELLEIAVTVRQNRPIEQRPTACHLVKWFAPEPEPAQESE
ncbi:MAG: type IV pilus modification PilV family protein [Thermoguttaceae bacterium]